MIVRKVATAFGLLFAILSAGCSGQKDGNFATVSGLVKQGAVPVDGAKVTFHSTVETKGQREIYSAITDSSGKYLIAANGKDPGIPPGLYKVTITKQGFKDSKSTQPEMDAGQLEAQMSAATPGTLKNALPKEYENVASTKLSVTLEVGKNDNKDFDLPK